MKYVRDMSTEGRRAFWAAVDEARKEMASGKWPSYVWDLGYFDPPEVRAMPREPVVVVEERLS